MPPTLWEDWPVAERSAGSPIDQIFTRKWSGRGRAFRCRTIPGPMLGGSHTFSASNVWEAADFGTTKVWLPRWAKRLTVRFGLLVTSVSSGFDPTEVVRVYARAKIGSVLGSETSVYLACKVGQRLQGYPPELEDFCAGVLQGADGTPSDDGQFYARESSIVLDDSVRDTAADFTYELKKQGGQNPTTIRNSPTDSSGAGTGRHYRSALLWYDLETEDD